MHPTHLMILMISKWQNLLLHKHLSLWSSKELLPQEMFFFHWITCPKPDSPVNESLLSNCLKVIMELNPTSSESYFYSDNAPALCHRVLDHEFRNWSILDVLYQCWSWRWFLFWYMKLCTLLFLHYFWLNSKRNSFLLRLNQYLQGVQEDKLLECNFLFLSASCGELIDPASRTIVVRSGTFNNGNWIEGSKAYFECELGYGGRIVQHPSVCQANGTWTYVAKNCEGSIYTFKKKQS